MFCRECGAKNSDGAAFCKACGASLNAGAYTQSAAERALYRPGAKPKRTIRKILNIIGVVVAFALIIAVISKSKSPVDNIKEIVFDDYTSQRLGTTVEQVFKYNPKWKYEKISSDYYQVTVSGFYEKWSMNIDAIFDFYDYGDYCYAVINHAVVNGQSFNDNLSLRTVMAILCNNLEMANRLLTQSFLSSLLGW